MVKVIDRINQIVSNEPSGWIKDAKERQASRSWSKNSFRIAVRILREIRMQKPVNGMTQKTLADAMGVTPQYINKVVKGKENLTLETIAKIEQVLGITLIEIHVQGASSFSIEKTSGGETVDRNLAVSTGKKIIDFKTDYTKPTGTNG
jgi:plasmid maintenance system antidote protein VapI